MEPRSLGSLRSLSAFGRAESHLTQRTVSGAAGELLPPPPPLRFPPPTPRACLLSLRFVLPFPHLWLCEGRDRRPSEQRAGAGGLARQIR